MDARDGLDGFDLQDAGGRDQDIGAKPGLQACLAIDDRDCDLTVKGVPAWASSKQRHAS